MESVNTEKTAGDAGQERFFAEFPVPTYEAWKAEAEKALKGASFESRMITKTYEEIDLKPIYRPEDLEGKVLHKTLPGGAPYLRGAHASGYMGSSWLIAQECDRSLPETFNETLKNELTRGLTALNFRLDTPTRLGLDPDTKTAVAGDEGLSLSCLPDLAAALEEIDLERWPVLSQAGVSPLPVLALFGALTKARGVKSDKLSGFIAGDPLGMLAARGEIPGTLETFYDEMAAAVRWAGQKAPALRTILADGTPYHNSGANAIQELGFALATAVTYIRAMQERGLEFSEVAPHMQLSFSLGANMFMELAKIRAARVLWYQVAEAFGGGADTLSIKIHGRTSHFTKTVYDPYVNMLRTTTEAFAGVVGGLDSLHVGPFDEAVRQGDEFSRRIARNTQIILQQECTLTQPVDPAGGSWYVEALTDHLAREAWKLFCQVEEQGGMLKALQSGFPQAQAEKTSKKRFSNLAKRRDVIVGNNMYANLTEKPLEVPHWEPDVFRHKRSEALSEYRSLSDEVEQVKRLGHLAELRGKADSALMEAAIDAAIAGCTVGEISSAIRREELAQVSVPKLKMHRTAEQYEQIRQVTEQYIAATGDNVKIFSANMGPIPQHKPRADFSRGFLEVGGFQVIGNTGFPGVEEAAEAAAASGADAVVICSTDATYPELVPPLARLIKEKMPGVWLFLAGLPPEDLQKVYKEAGVDDFIHVRADCHSVLLHLQQRKGMQA